MELYDFKTKTEKLDISVQALAKQRENLNEDVFKELSKLSLIDFYEKFPEEVKIYNGHVLIGIDGSDCEVPNTPETRKCYKSINTTDENRVARIKLSNAFDILNKYVVDTKIECYKYCERNLGLQHVDASNYIREHFPAIYIMDRGYISLQLLYEIDKRNAKFLVRLDKKSFKSIRKQMTSDDELVEILYEYNRVSNFEDSSP